MVSQFPLITVFVSMSLKKATHSSKAPISTSKPVVLYIVLLRPANNKISNLQTVNKLYMMNLNTNLGSTSPFTPMKSVVSISSTEALR
jgi:hypothetical protein